MSTSTHAAATGTATTPAADTATLRTLYYARFAFAIVWAILIAVTASTLNPLSIALLVLYPLVDVAAAIIDFRSSGASRAKTPLYANMALSLLAAIGLGVAVTTGIPAVLMVWGVWAITSGIVQLVVAITRHRLAGQWPMILSGGISTVAGTGFILMSASTPSILGLAGYATLGGIFFLLSVIRLHRSAARAASAAEAR